LGIANIIPNTDTCVIIKKKILELLKFKMKATFTESSFIRLSMKAMTTSNKEIRPKKICSYKKSGPQKQFYFTFKDKKLEQTNYSNHLLLYGLVQDSS
jgi:hypothetical protein